MIGGRSELRKAELRWRRDDVDLGAVLTKVQAYSPGRLGRLFDMFEPLHIASLEAAWWQWSLPAQRAPAGDWRVWLIRAGRGFGKTRAGAEWVSEVARSDPGARIALVGHTLSDVRRVMVEGESGILSVAREGEAVRFAATKGEVYFPSGAKAWLFSAEAPESLRGPSHCHAWCDELGKWSDEDGTKAWDNLTLTMRHGAGPHRMLVTTTPRTTELMQKVMATADHETLGRTKDNPHLSASFVEAMITEYGGTRLGRQELDGEFFAEAEARCGLATRWRRAGLRDHRCGKRSCAWW